MYVQKGDHNFALKIPFLTPTVASFPENINFTPEQQREEDIGVRALTFRSNGLPTPAYTLVSILMSHLSNWKPPGRKNEF